jgi:hypothetical protein
MWEGYLAHNRPNFARLHGCQLPHDIVVRAPVTYRTCLVDLSASQPITADVRMTSLTSHQNARRSITATVHHKSGRLSCNLIAQHYDRRLRVQSVAQRRPRRYPDDSRTRAACPLDIIGTTDRGRGGPRDAPLNAPKAIHSRTQMCPNTRNLPMVPTVPPGTGKHHPVSSHTDPPTIRVSNFHHWGTTSKRPCGDPVPAQTRTSISGGQWLIQAVSKIRHP